MDPARYRTRLCLDLSRSIVLPILVLSASLRLFGKSLGPLTFPVHLAFIISWASLKGALTRYTQENDAKKLGARPIPRIVGKWPGNIDVLFNMLRGFKTSYVLDVYLQLFEEYQCTALNTRILWSDNVRTSDIR